MIRKSGISQAMLELAVGNTDMAWQSWRRSLELSDLFLMDIGKRSLAVLAEDDEAANKLIRRDLARRSRSIAIGWQWTHIPPQPTES